MKISIILIISIVFFVSNCFSQNITKKDFQDKLPAQHIQLSDDQQKNKIIQIILQYYGKSFKFYQSLLKGKYNFEKSTFKKETRYDLTILGENNKSKKPVRIGLIKMDCGNGDSELVFEKKDIEKYIDLKEFNGTNARFSAGSPIQIVDREKILFDQMILKNDDIPPEYWRILNETVTENLDDQYGNPLVLFRLLQAGVIIPYGGGSQSKVITIDSWYHTIVYFDSNVMQFEDEPINQVYGSLGRGQAEFDYPTGITMGRSSQDQDHDYYPIYIADQQNLRICKVDYVVDINNPKIGYFNNASFTPYDNILFPYDIAFARGRYLESNPNPENSDKLWVSEALSYTPYLSCYNEFGALRQRFIGYYDDNTSTFYNFLPGTASRVSTYQEYERVISFIDNMRNCLVSCAFNGDGTANCVQNNDGYYIIAKDILYFPASERINSVKFQATAGYNAIYPYIWVTSADRIHCIKMKVTFQNNDEYIQTQYLASTNKPYNTSPFNPFTNLLNTMTTNYYNDLATIEVWNYQYGVRRYLPFADIYADTLFDYCGDSTDQMRLKGVFTNDCWLQISADRRKPDGNWEPVIIKKISGQIINDFQANLYRLAGSTELWNSGQLLIQLDLPASDYFLGGRVRLHLRITPDNVNPYATENDFVHKDYEVNVSKNCNPKPGGCPYLYVNDVTNEYKVDNNILHRSEFTEYSGQDILDRYKVNINPLIDATNIIQMAIVENESDNSMFDETKLYYIDHPNGTTLGVTESNDVAVYNQVDVISTDNASQSFIGGWSDITTLIQYSTQVGTKGYINDTIYAHYPNSSSSLKSQNKNAKVKIDNLKSKDKDGIESDKDKNINQSDRINKNTKLTKTSRVNSISVEQIDSLAVIALVGNLDTLRPVIRKTWAANLFAYDYAGGTFSTMFARREIPSEVIIPVFGISGGTVTNIEHVDVNWLSDFKLKYLSVVPIHYNVYALNPLSLQQATLINQNWQVDVTTPLQAVDQNYANMDQNSYISLNFSTNGVPPVPDGYVRDYIFETVGQYTPGAKNQPLRVINQQVPLTNKLYHNYPNPFNPKTIIKYDLKNATQVKITVYNILGQEVKILVNEFKKAGSYDITFDGSNYASGVYFYRIEAGSFVEAKKMVLIK